MTGGELPRVAIWRDYWLARSETFIRDQTAALSRWEPVRIGLRRFADPLVEPDYAPYTDAFLHRVASRLPAAPPVRRRWHDIVADPRVRLVHAHFGLDGIHALPVAQSAGKPLVVTFHGMDVTSMPERPGLEGRRYRNRLLHLFEGAHTLVAISEYIADRLADLGAPKEKVVVHHIGAPMGPALPAAPAQERRGVVSVGRMIPKKGLDDLLDAMSMLEEPLRSTPVTLVGYGPSRQRLERRAADLRLDVTFTGRLDSDDVMAALRRAEVFVGPSRSEGFGIVFLEAAKAQLPVVAYRVGGVPEAVADGVTGLLAPAGNVVALAEALQDLLLHPDRARRMGEAGERRVREFFDIERQTRQLEGIYDRVVAG